MKHTSELTRAQKAYDRTVMALDKAMVRETVALARLDRAKAVYADALKAKVAAAEQAYAAAPWAAEKVAI